jgi:MFS transporter, DHA1 family, multidrug resistance protein
MQAHSSLVDLLRSPVRPRGLFVFGDATHMIASASRPRLSVLIFLSALAVLPVNMFVPSLPNIAHDLDADYALVNLAIAGYAIVTAVTHLLAGALSDRFGRRPVALTALVVFTVASVGCSLATDIGSFLAFRMAQGVVIAGYSVSLAAIRDTADERKAASRIGYVSSAWALAPMIGPTIGGLLDALFGWRASFIAFALLGSIGFALATLWFEETNKQPSTSILQMRGYYNLVRSAHFWAYALCMAFSIGTLYAFLGGAPLVADSLGGVSAIAVGLYMGLVPAGFILGSTLAGRYGSQHAPHVFMVAGRVLTCVGLVAGLALYLGELRHILAFFGPCVFVGLGNGLTMPAANAGVLSLKPGLSGTALGLANALTVTGAAAIASLSGLVMTDANPQYTVLIVMLASSLAALVAALTVASLGKR